METQQWTLQNPEGVELMRVPFEKGAPPRVNDILPVWLDNDEDHSSAWRVLESDGRSCIAVMEPATERVQFFCPACGDWLDDGGTVHDEGEHDGDDRRVRRWRASKDDGATWYESDCEGTRIDA